jgi:hypothetical protein
VLAIGSLFAGKLWLLATWPETGGFWSGEGANDRAGEDAGDIADRAAANRRHFDRGEVSFGILVSFACRILQSD